MGEKMNPEAKVFDSHSDAQISQYNTHEPRSEPPKVYSLFSLLALAVSLMATWEAIGGTMGSALASGGPVSLVWGFITSFIGNIFTSMSLAEAAAMWPSAGGQYQFVAELSPPSIRSGVSWYCGWLSVVGWIAFTASAPAASSNLVMGLVQLNHPEFQVKTWHSSMIYWAITLIALGFNLYGNRILPYIQNVICALHVGFFFAIFIAVLALDAPKHSAAFVFTEFRNSTGWSSDGIAWCLGMLTSCYVMIGYDSATHLSEEIPNPAVNIPRAMLGAIIINGSMGFVVLIVLLFSMGSLDAALSSGPFPIIHIFSTITRGNPAAASAMTCTIIISASFATFGLLTTASRTLWAFSRDGGTPFSSKIGALSSKRQIPSTALYICAAVVILLGALNIASTSAFAAILSLTIVGLNLSYLMPVALMLYRRLFSPGTLVPGPFKLGKFGIVANVLSVSFLVFTSIFLLFPTVQPVTAKNMNYAIVVLGGILILTTIDYIIRGRKVYSGPQLIVNGVAVSE